VQGFTESLRQKDRADIWVVCLTECSVCDKERCSFGKSFPIAVSLFWPLIWFSGFFDTSSLSGINIFTQEGNTKWKHF
jgi:hypothetical protein